MVKVSANPTFMMVKGGLGGPGADGPTLTRSKGTIARTL